MVGVLPLLMYPLMGTSFFQLSQFIKGHSAEVLVLGAEILDQFPELPPLLNGERFATNLFDNPGYEVRHLRVSRGEGLRLSRENQLKLAAGDLDAVVILPPELAPQLAELHRRLESIGELGRQAAVQVPDPRIIHASSRESSRIAELKIDRILQRWMDRIATKNFADSGVPRQLAEPFVVVSQDISEGSSKYVGQWAMVLTFVVFIWTLTGAFYPAIDLCAGEKERGTLETLLASPATRNEIVWGKLITVAIFSMAMGLLNLVGMTFTAQFAAQHMGDVGGVEDLTPPPLLSLVWLVLALPPLAALFSALSLAFASFAKSTKEGQYYLMPLFLVLLPLMMIPMAPGVELTLGNSLVPVMGLVLVLQSLLEQRVAEAAPYMIPATLVTIGCCLLAIKWAVAQFNQESVLFRESERFEIRAWLWQMFRDRRETPNAAMAVAAVAAIFALQFFANTLLASSGLGPDLSSFAVSILVSQACVLLPALLLTCLLTTKPLKTLRLHQVPAWQALVGAGGLAIVLHPLGVQLAIWISQLYPLDEAVANQAKAFGDVLNSAPSPLIPVLLVGLLPALFEELTFRGFVLTGLQRAVGNRGAIVLTAVAFGAVHTLLQQSLGAMVVGIFLGYLALRTGSLVPCVIFHLFYNSLSVLLSYYSMGPTTEGQGQAYPPTMVVGGLLLAGFILRWLPNTGAACPVAAAGLSDKDNLHSAPGGVADPRLASEGAD